MAFPGFNVLKDLVDLGLLPSAFGRGNNKTGFQKAHIIGDKFWTDQLNF